MKLKKVTLLSTLLLLSTLVGCKSNKISADKDVTISVSTYKGGYPAVWFSPSSGAIKEVGHEELVDVKSGFESEWNCWIEPQEPEIKVFRGSNDSLEGISYIGVGDSLYNSNTESTSLHFSHRIADEDKFKKGAVFVIKTKQGSSKLKIVDFNKEQKVLQFRWKKL